MFFLISKSDEDSLISQIRAFIYEQIDFNPQCRNGIIIGETTMRTGWVYLILVHSLGYWPASGWQQSRGENQIKCQPAETIQHNLLQACRFLPETAKEKLFSTVFQLKGRIENHAYISQSFASSQQENKVPVYAIKTETHLAADDKIKTFFKSTLQIRQFTTVPKFVNKRKKIFQRKIRRQYFKPSDQYGFRCI